MSKKLIKNISDKLTKVSDTFSVKMYDNGYVFEICGRDDNDDYKTARILCNTIEEVQTLMVEATQIEKDE